MQTQHNVALDKIDDGSTPLCADQRAHPRHQVDDAAEAPERI
jgi:hypothetical protein